MALFSVSTSLFWLCSSLVQTLVVGAVKVRNGRLAGHDGSGGSEGALRVLWPRACVSHTEIGGLLAHRKHGLISPEWGMSRAAASWIAVRGVCIAQFCLYIVCLIGFLSP